MGSKAKIGQTTSAVEVSPQWRRRKAAKARAEEKAWAERRPSWETGEPVQTRSIQARGSGGRA